MNYRLYVMEQYTDAQFIDRSNIILHYGYGVEMDLLWRPVTMAASFLKVGYNFTSD